MRRWYLLALISFICPVLLNAQTLWQAMPNSKDFFDLRCIYQDPVTSILYVGLPKKIVGGDTVNCITYWDGQQWAAMGNGASWNSDHVSSIIRYHDTIYAAGAFQTDYGAPASGIMKWSGAIWKQLGNGNCEGTQKVNGHGNVDALYELNGDLITLGRYDTIGCLLGNGIAKWNGLAWNTDYQFPNTYPLGIPYIYSLCIFQGNIYVAGQFSSVDSSGDELAYYDGIKWKTFGGGLYGGLTVPFDMITYKNKVYVAGRFDKSEGNPGNNIAAWNGLEWDDVQGGTDGQIFKLLIYHDKLYVFGGFAHAGGVPASQMAYWDGQKWCGISHNFTTTGISDAGIYNDTILVGAKIYQGLDTIKYFAKFLGGDYTDSCSTPIGISETTGPTFSISLTPNPTHTTLSIYTDQPIQSITITNILGETVLQQSALHQKEIKVDVAALPGGVYLLQTTNEKGRAVKKFVKE